MLASAHNRSVARYGLGSSDQDLVNGHIDHPPVITRHFECARIITARQRPRVTHREWAEAAGVARVTAESPDVAELQL
jgi:hypothetical protein